MANPNNSVRGVAVAGVPKSKKQMGGGKSNLGFQRSGNPSNTVTSPGRKGAAGIVGPVGSARDSDAPAGGGKSNLGDMSRPRVKAPGDDGLASSGGRVSRGEVRHPSTSAAFHGLGHNMDVRKGK